jgi:hypothetical protein
MESLHDDEFGDTGRVAQRARKNATSPSISASPLRSPCRRILRERRYRPSHPNAYRKYVIYSTFREEPPLNVTSFFLASIALQTLRLYRVEISSSNEAGTVFPSLRSLTLDDLEPRRDFPSIFESSVSIPNVRQILLFSEVSMVLTP